MYIFKFQDSYNEVYWHVVAKSKKDAIYKILKQSDIDMTYENGIPLTRGDLMELNRIPIDKVWFETF